MITGHCSGDDALHDTCPLPRACSCPGHLSAGKIDDRRPEDLTPIRGAPLPPTDRASGDHLPTRPARPRAARLVDPSSSGPVHRRTLDPTDGADLDVADGAVFSLGITNPDHQETTTMPPKKHTCPETGCRYVAASPNGLAIHRGRAHGAGSAKPTEPGKARARRPPAPARPPPTAAGHDLPPAAGSSLPGSTRNRYDQVLPVALGGRHVGQVTIELEFDLFDLSRHEVEQLLDLVDKLRLVASP